MEALQRGQYIEKLFLLRTATGTEIHAIKQYAHQVAIPISMVPAEKLDSFTKVAHQGVVAITALIPYYDLQTIISNVVEAGEVPLMLLLDGVKDVRNVGAIARTAWCCGVQALILPTSHSASLTEEAIKTSAGALNQIKVCRAVSVPQAIDTLKLNGIQLLGTQMHSSTPVYQSELTLPTCIVLGGEDTGISKDVLKRADSLIHIPMYNKFDSLNVSVAAGMILYEVVKQRMGII